MVITGYSGQNRAYFMLPHAINQISYALGANPLIIQGGGGNISFKDAKVNSLWIKASGKWLEHANTENVFLELDLNKAKEWLSTGKSDFPSDWQKPSNSGVPLRASIETSLHLLFDSPVVVHTHPVSILSHVVQQDPQASLSPLLCDLNWALIPYQKPGRDLAQAISEHPQFGKCSIFILQNHGLVVCADTPEEAQAITLDVILKTSTPMKYEQFSVPELNKTLASIERIGFKAPSNPLIHSLACNPSNLNFFDRANNVLYPDQAVFLGKNAVVIDEITKAPSSLEAPFMVIPKVGVFVNQKASVMVEAMLLCHAEVLSRLPVNAQLNYLSDSAVAELTNWDAEKYRQSMN
jgi:rhamnose utilization protein RhaD (predicted bifunctional aldolase and dehydrogenase)